MPIMKNLLFVFLSTMVFGSAICIGQTQPQNQDVIYMKNGGILKGTITEVIPNQTVKIQIDDGRVFVYQVAELEKITMSNGQTLSFTTPVQTYQPQTAQTPQVSSTRSGNRFAIFGGFSKPAGDFGSTTGLKAGFAKTRFAIGADGSKVLSPAVSWMSSAYLSVNSVDYKIIKYLGFSSGEVGSWTLRWLLTGLKVAGNPTPEVELFGFGQFGLLYGSSPEMTTSYYFVYDEYSISIPVTIESASASTLGFGFGGGMNLGHFSLSLRYLSGEPEYKITTIFHETEITYEFTESEKIKQPTSCILITGGYAF